jgi:hypothetical protein
MTLDEFNEKFSGLLELELSEPPVFIAPDSLLINEKALPTAVITSLKVRAEVYDDSVDDGAREPTPDELDAVVVLTHTLRMKSHCSEITEHRTPGYQQHFTVRDLFAAVEQHERLTRPHSEWFGGIDMHHIFFEGLHQGADGTLEIYWGS